MTPVLQEAITWRLYPFHAGWCALSFVIGESRKPLYLISWYNRLIPSDIIVVYFFYPETAGVNLESMTGQCPRYGI